MAFSREDIAASRSLGDGRSVLSDGSVVASADLDRAAETLGEERIALQWEHAGA